MEWVKSSLSCSNGNSCVEVAELPGEVLVRNSRDQGDPDAPVLSFTRDEWVAFIGGAQRGEFNHFGIGRR